MLCPSAGQSPLADQHYDAPPHPQPYRDGRRSPVCDRRVCIYAHAMPPLSARTCRRVHLASCSTPRCSPAMMLPNMSFPLSAAMTEGGKPGRPVKHQVRIAALRRGHETASLHVMPGGSARLRSVPPSGRPHGRTESSAHAGGSGGGAGEGRSSWRRRRPQRNCAHAHIAAVGHTGLWSRSALRTRCTRLPNAACTMFSCRDCSCVRYDEESCDQWCIPRSHCCC